MIPMIPIRQIPMILIQILIQIPIPIQIPIQIRHQTRTIPITRTRTIAYPSRFNFT